MLGHYRLWDRGVQHNDISEKNLMYDKLNENRGILNDFDLAHLADRDPPSGLERTGTMPFMALDLLTDEAWEGGVKRLYRHDCESFAWVLLWICCRYEKGEEIPNAPLSTFITGDYARCRQVKYDILSELPGIKPTTSYKQYWEASTDLVGQFVKDRFGRVRKNASLSELRDEEVMRRCLQTLKSARVLIFAELLEGTLNSCPDGTQT